MIIKSYAFRDNGDIPPRLTCDGANVNPVLGIESVPLDTKSLVLIMDDLDTSFGGIFTHWVVWNIPSQTAQIAEGDLPRGAVQGRNSFGNNGYGGPCPPRGSKSHRYVFKLYALNTELDLLSGSEKEKVERKMEGHILEQASVTGLYARTI